MFDSSSGGDNGNGARRLGVVGNLIVEGS